VFASSYLASAHSKPQSHDQLDFRSHTTAANDMETSNRLGRGFPVLPMWIGPRRHDSWWKNRCLALNQFLVMESR